MNNNTEIDDLHRCGDSSSSLRGGCGSIGSFYIPGITAKARCLSSSDFQPQLGDFSPYISGSESLNRCDDSIESNSSSRRRASMGHAGSGRGNVLRKDARFSKMMEELSAARKGADEARAAALRVKERFLNESSSSSHRSLDDDPIFNELKRFCRRTSV
jgi:hypothetical protein